MAEAMYEIDEKLKQQAIKKLPAEFKKIVKKFYEKINSNQNVHE